MLGINGHFWSQRRNKQKSSQRFFTIETEIFVKIGENVKI